MKKPLQISVVGSLTGRYGISVAAQKHVELLEPLCAGLQSGEGHHARHDVLYHHAAPPSAPPVWYNGKRVIGYWVVESSVAAAEFKDVADACAQIWTCSAASARAISALGSATPVHIIPHPVPAPEVVPDRSGRDTVTTLFAFAPGWERKNPEGVIRAWQRAFADMPQARLIVKMRHGSAAAVDCLTLLAGGDERIEIITQDMPDLTPLYERADLFLSLHHAGAFELHAAEAAAFGLPVITSAVGGVLDYLPAEAARFISGKAIVSRMGDALNCTGEWLDPDEDLAVAALRELGADAGLRARMGHAARESVLQLLNPARIQSLMAAALAELPAEAKAPATRRAIHLLPRHLTPLRSGLELVGDAPRGAGPHLPVIMSHRRSGTHLLGEIITRHWQTPWLKTHHFPDLLPQANPAVYVLRNPVDCLHSTWRWWQEGAANAEIAEVVRGMSFADWLGGKAGPALGYLSHRTLPTDSLEVGRGSMYDPMLHWLHHWQEAQRAGIPVLLYEDLVRPEAVGHVTTVLAQLLHRQPASPVEVIEDAVGFSPSPSPQPQSGKALKAWPKAALKRLHTLLTPELLESIHRPSLEGWLNAE